MDLLKFVGVVVIILALHFLLWGKIFRDWCGHLKGFKQALLFAACFFCEALITILLGIYVLNINSF